MKAVALVSVINHYKWVASISRHPVIFFLIGKMSMRLDKICFIVNETRRSMYAIKDLVYFI